MRFQRSSFGRMGRNRSEKGPFPSCRRFRGFRREHFGESIGNHRLPGEVGPVSAFGDRESQGKWMPFGRTEIGTGSQKLSTIGVRRRKSSEIFRMAGLALTFKQNPGHDFFEWSRGKFAEPGACRIGWKRVPIPRRVPVGNFRPRQGGLANSIPKSRARGNEPPRSFGNNRTREFPRRATQRGGSAAKTFPYSVMAQTR